MGIRAYENQDEESLIGLIRVLQNYVAGLDPLGLNKSGDEFNVPAYVERLLRRIVLGNGKIFVAQQDGDIFGCIAGVVQENPPEDQLEVHSTTSGRIVELVVSPERRGKNIGKELMKAMEAFFSEMNCTHIRVECFAPNTGAHSFYEKCGYSDRSVDMVKVLPLSL